MLRVIVAWCNGNEAELEEHVPLSLVARRHHRLGYNTDVHVVFLMGFAALSHRYKDGLRELGYRLHDAEAIFQQLLGRYGALGRFGDYERNCFLRWLVIRNIFSGDPILHLDGDVVLNECPAVIADKLLGKTFVLQGCPALTAISDYNWFEEYRTELDNFAANIADYSAKAWMTRDGWETSFKTRWAGSRFRAIVSSDQDLLSHLIHVGAIRQDSVESVLRALEGYAIFENPLILHLYCETIPYTYTREKGIDYLSYRWIDAGNQCFKRRVLLWHMQSDFNHYASMYILRSRIHPLMKSWRLPFSLKRASFEDRLNRRMVPLMRHQSRRAVFEHFFGRHDFAGLMNGRTWWQPGVFA